MSHVLPLDIAKLPLCSGGTGIHSPLPQDDSAHFLSPTKCGPSGCAFPSARVFPRVYIGVDTMSPRGGAAGVHRHKGTLDTFSRCIIIFLVLAITLMFVQGTISLALSYRHLGHCSNLCLTFFLLPHHPASVSEGPWLKNLSSPRTIGLMATAAYLTSALFCGSVLSQTARSLVLSIQTNVKNN